ncbi:TIGR04197 family type VII secretion effector [Enterococcus hulanensis]|uniref:TIGR04197 family type VII secretion effector n=1 Tax=Enterococcus hulanensis TaxID=2559929 RepID=A0ABU3F0M3_9ENTE|nr:MULTISPECIES: TIGR04197 family type VII secretion effector [Enterococcus]MBO0410577.1 TIGR04197 family type VII secretion effector [Enterococcus hulanensis]MBX8936959.1 TIGR04197 family type VII secretion effector [Enterococcus gilvus]MDT2600680.1 TIGR04197 family type VII secretion effector [Enterococcus hulanensis]MDT2610203.1 TIGR04197 family type VII secretion effector [Enterococcus hulanensis]MDT2617389.1 TIGR04197 family type VII secretion effector [Enterococcus hulanensis]
MAVKSNLGVAQQRASALKSAAGSLTAGGVATSDSQTTVAGNKSAQNAVKSTYNAVLKVSEAVSSASSNINSVAKNFEAIDQAGKELFTRKQF